MPKKKTMTGNAEVHTGTTHHPFSPDPANKSYPSSTLFITGMTQEGCAEAYEFLRKHFHGDKVEISCGPDKKNGGFGIAIEINLSTPNDAPTVRKLPDCGDEDHA